MWKSRPPHWTMWTPDHPTEHCELQTSPLNNVNSRSHKWTMWTPDYSTEKMWIPDHTNDRPPHWTLWTPDHLTEQCKLQITALNNVNSRSPLWTMWTAVFMLSLALKIPDWLFCLSIENINYYIPRILGTFMHVICYPTICLACDTSILLLLCYVF